MSQRDLLLGSLPGVGILKTEVSVHKYPALTFKNLLHFYVNSDPKGKM